MEGFNLRAGRRLICHISVPLAGLEIFLASPIAAPKLRLKTVATGRGLHMHTVVHDMIWWDSVYFVVLLVVGKCLQWCYRGNARRCSCISSLVEK